MNVSFRLIDEAGMTFEESDLTGFGPRTGEVMRSFRRRRGALVIEDPEAGDIVTLVDDFDPLLSGFCLDAPVALARGAAFDYDYAETNETAALRPEGDAVAVLTGGFVEFTCPRGALVQALAACGARYVGLKRQELSGQAGLAPTLRVLETGLAAATAAAGG